ncbi:hypothetical protein SELMODRAFT_83001, partial [Selaginella moellendorffii]
LSGLLNFTDGLWSSTSSERILTFTTNHIEELDGSMVMHTTSPTAIPLPSRCWLGRTWTLTTIIYFQGSRSLSAR